MSQDNGRKPRLDRAHQSSSPRAVMGNVTDVMHDITHLLELQAKLFATDSKAATRRALLPIVAMVVGVCVLLGCVPVGLLAAAEVVQIEAGLSRPLSLVCAAGAGLILAVALLAVGWWRLRRGFHEFDRSRNELLRNIAWVKQTLRGTHRRTPQSTNHDRFVQEKENS